MRYLFDLNFKSLLVLAGVSFFALTLYSKELIAYLMEFDSTETNSIDQKNQSMKMSKDSLAEDLDLVSSNLEVKKLELQGIEKKFLETETALGSLLEKKKEMTAKVEKLKFELVDQENKKKIGRK